MTLEFSSPFTAKQAAKSKKLKPKNKMRGRGSSSKRYLKKQQEFNSKRRKLAVRMAFVRYVLKCVAHFFTKRRRVNVYLFCFGSIFQTQLRWRDIKKSSLFIIAQTLWFVALILGHRYSEEISPAPLKRNILMSMEALSVVLIWRLKIAPLHSMAISLLAPASFLVRVYFSQWVYCWH